MTNTTTHATTLFTRPELEALKSELACDRSVLSKQPELLDRLLGQAEYALDCAALLDEAVHFPAEPYTEAEALVAKLTDGVNEIWNRHRYGGAAGADGRPGSTRGPT